MKKLVLTLRVDDDKFYAETSHGIRKEIGQDMYESMLKFCTKEEWRILSRGNDFIRYEGWSFFDQSDVYRAEICGNDFDVNYARAGVEISKLQRQDNQARIKWEKQLVDRIYAAVEKRATENLI